MKKIKVILFFCFAIATFTIMDCVDAGILDYKYAVILTVVSVVACMDYLMCEKKKSAVYRKYNGQAHKVHNKTLHKYCTPNKGGVSSGL